jgi:spermidine synthase
LFPLPQLFTAGEGPQVVQQQLLKKGAAQKAALSVYRSMKRNGKSSRSPDCRINDKPMDGADLVKGRNSDIDIVIVDSTDIVGFAKSLFTDKFSTSIKNCLTENGLFVTLSESLHFHKDIVIGVQETMRAVIPYCGPLYGTHRYIRRQLVHFFGWFHEA